MYTSVQGWMGVDGTLVNMSISADIKWTWVNMSVHHWTWMYKSEHKLTSVNIYMSDVSVYQCTWENMSIVTWVYISEHEYICMSILYQWTWVYMSGHQWTSVNMLNKTGCMYSKFCVPSRFLSNRKQTFILINVNIIRLLTKYTFDG